ncbi:hypothetical protein L3V79_06715 [Thiotrichales bacterium 19S9-12]|nr:hypothetical protein [Thiotrichales bacterium 19S9-11]MCF6812046.1 hypothetical protein [Thiotrichales bacterium 19S9-12]
MHDCYQLGHDVLLAGLIIMKHIRLYTGDDNQSHLEEISIEYLDAKYGKLSKATNTKSIIFGKIDELKEVGWHNPQNPQYIVMLKGAMEIEVGDGSKQVFHPGDVLLLEDSYRARTHYSSC